MLADSNQLQQAGYDTSLKVSKVLFYYNFKINSAYFTLAVIFKILVSWLKQINLQKKIQSQQLKTELALLKSQVHPHFLFNTLNSLYVSAYEYGDDTTAEGIGKLSHLLRYMLYETNQAKVPLVNEVDYLKNYVALQEMRFGNDTEIRFNIDGDISGFVIAPMLLITLIENAFKHGVSPAQKTSISIHLVMKVKRLEFIVQNDLLEKRIKPALEGNSGGIGLTNLKKRLMIIYPEKFTFNTTIEHKKFTARLILL